MRDSLAPEAQAVSLDELTERATARLLTHVFGAHRWLAIPFVLIFTAVLSTALDAWRLAAITLAFSVGIVAWFARRRMEGSGLIVVRFRTFTLVAGVLQTTVVFAFGGVAGPMLPPMTLLALVAALFTPTRTSAVLVLGIQIPALWAMAVLHHYGVFPEIVPTSWQGLWVTPGGEGPGAWVAALFATFALFAAWTIGRLVRSVVSDLVAETLEERDRALAFHREAAASMSMMSAEIAHELKNPLASIKGLAVLVRKDLSGTTAERMDVLRREVDRMQGIIEEFLAYSRPLVPLDESEVDLAELARDVAVLHDGIASQRGITLRAPTLDQEVHLRCDPKKVRQVLINLVQNALDASPRGAVVQMQVSSDAQGARLRVLDEGTGLDQDAAARIFDVGFTTKAEGSGLGLAVARGLARQHGGELHLAARESGRGCVATLTLPRERKAQEAA